MSLPDDDGLPRTQPDRVFQRRRGVDVVADEQACPGPGVDGAVGDVDGARGEVGEHEQTAVAQRAGEREDGVVIGQEQREDAVGDEGFRPTQLDERPVVREDRTGIVDLRGRVECSKFGLTRSHGVPVLNPACSVSSHCIGVRPLSRERSRSASSTSSAGRPSLVVAST